VFNSREITFLGGGGLLAILCLLLPIGFAGKIVLGGIVLVASVVLVFAKTKDNQPYDVAAWKRFQKSITLKHYSRHGGAEVPEPRPSRNQSSSRSKNQPSGQQGSTSLPAPAFTIIALPDSDDDESAQDVEVTYPVKPPDDGLDEVRPSSVVTYILVVIAVYVLYWLWHGGMESISTLFSTLR
jgi:hypothetical protein